MTNFKRSGKSVSGGKLTHAIRNGQVVGHINETLGLFMAHADPKHPGWFKVCYSMDEARALFSV